MASFEQAANLRDLRIVSMLKGNIRENFRKLQPTNFKNTASYPTFAVLIFKLMFAVVKIAGQQFRVQKDQTLYVPRVQGNAGDKVDFSEVLLANLDGKLSAGKNVKATVKAEIIDHVQGDKVIAFKMKRRKGFRKKHGHRTHYTKIRISDIV